MSHRTLSQPRIPTGIRQAVSLALLVGTFAFSGVAHAENWALLIGIDQYEDRNRITPLGAAASDARNLKAALVEVGGFPEANVRLLVSDGDAKPTRSNILKALSDLKKNAGAGDTVFVLYSGHGVEIDGMPYLLPFDASAADDDLLAESSVPVGLFRSKLGQIRARALVLAFDMCRNDPRKEGKGGLATENTLGVALSKGLDFKAGKTDTAPSAAPIAVTLYSCSPKERSYEWTEKGRGYFSYFLEQGLRGKAADSAGNVTVLSLANYVSRETLAAVQRGEQKTQTPYPSLDGAGADAFVLAKGAASSGTTTPAPAPEPSVVAANPSVLDTKARLSVTVNVPGATVTVDGQEIADGMFTANLLSVKEKVVEVKVEAGGYEGKLLSVTLLRGS